MASHNDLGRFGEELARQYLAEQNFEILFTNWKHSWYEIDIIAQRAGTLHFIEVKTRRSTRFGLPEESVDDSKLEKLMAAADEFLYQHSEWKQVQYDILSITVAPGKDPAFLFIEDVYL